MAPENRLYGATLNFHVPPAPASLYGTAMMTKLGDFRANLLHSTRRSSLHECLCDCVPRLRLT